MHLIKIKTQENCKYKNNLFKYFCIFKKKNVFIKQFTYNITIQHISFRKFWKYVHMY